MRVQNIKNVEKFLDVINSCKGEVELLTTDGDRLNLKSKLSQFVLMTNIFGSNSSIGELELVAHEREDIDKIFNYLVNGDV